MATGALGNIGMVAMSLVGLVGILRARRGGAKPTDAKAERRQAEAQEMERRMASYLAERQSGDRG